MDTDTQAAGNLVLRLRELKSEFEQGQAALADLDKQRQELRDGLLRLAGAIQVLEEFVPTPVMPAPQTDGAGHQHDS